jgi:plasmid stability protein
MSGSRTKVRRGGGRNLHPALLDTRIMPTLLISLLAPMAQLLVRNIESEVVRELKVRAARHGHSAEEEHRRILRDALRPSGSVVSFKALLLSMPDVGEDADFVRPRDLPRPIDL